MGERLAGAALEASLPVVMLFGRAVFFTVIVACFFGTVVSFGFLSTLGSDATVSSFGAVEPEATRFLPGDSSKGEPFRISPSLDSSPFSAAGLVTGESSAFAFAFAVASNFAARLFLISANDDDGGDKVGTRSRAGLSTLLVGDTAADLLIGLPNPSTFGLSEELETSLAILNPHSCCGPPPGTTPGEETRSTATKLARTFDTGRSNAAPFVPMGERPREGGEVEVVAVVVLLLLPLFSNLASRFRTLFEPPPDILDLFLCI